MSERHGVTSSVAARQHSAIALCEAFGFPEDDWPTFAGWASAPLAPRDQEALIQYIDVKIAERCWKPTDDLLSNLIDLEVDGVELTADEIYRFVATLMTEGVF